VLQIRLLDASTNTITHIHICGCHNTTKIMIGVIHNSLATHTNDNTSQLVSRHMPNVKVSKVNQVAVSRPDLLDDLRPLPLIH